MISLQGPWLAGGAPRVVAGRVSILPARFGHARPLLHLGARL